MGWGKILPHLCPYLHIKLYFSLFTIKSFLSNLSEYSFLFIYFSNTINSSRNIHFNTVIQTIQQFFRSVFYFSILFHELYYFRFTQSFLTMNIHLIYWLKTLVQRLAQYSKQMFFYYT